MINTLFLYILKLETKQSKANMFIIIKNIKEERESLEKQIHMIRT